MDSLIAIGSSASLIYGIYVIYQMAYNLGLNQDISHLAHELYFESASMILVLVSFGKYLESKSKNKTNEQIKQLEKFCQEKDLLMSGGSDYHGDKHKDLELGKGYGNLIVNEDVINKWI